ncbi:TonB-dependent receptor plug domain-containing protein, partial [Lysobacter sp. 2RAB21]
VVVTANRTAVSVNDLLTPVEVLDRADIERSQARDLNDLLRGRAGITIANQGGAGKLTTLFLRGSESDHVLVLVDGIRIGSPTSGLAALQDLPLELIDRIEIVRGPRSSLYGADAIGGVIQIFTRRPQGAFAPNFSLSLGSNQTHRGSAGGAGKGERGWYSINAAHEDTDGINACRGKPSPGGAGCFTNSPDRDGYRNSSLTVQGGYPFNEQWDAEARVLRAQANNLYDGSQNNQADTVQQVAGAKLRYKPNDRVSVSLNAGRSADLSDNYKNGKYSSTFDTRRQLGSVQGDFRLGQ